MHAGPKYTFELGAISAWRDFGEEVFSNDRFRVAARDGAFDGVVLEKVESSSIAPKTSLLSALSPILDKTFSTSGLPKATVFLAGQAER